MSRRSWLVLICAGAFAAQLTSAQTAPPRAGNQPATIVYPAHVEQGRVLVEVKPGDLPHIVYVAPSSGVARLCIALPGQAYAWNVRDVGHYPLPEGTLIHRTWRIGVAEICG